MSSSTSSSDSARLAVYGFAVAVALFELVAGLAAPVDQGRHEVDRVSARLEQAPELRVVVLGDSVTYGVLPDLPAGWFDGVSNSALGTVGNYYLLRRALRWGHPLEHVFYIQHPETLALELNSERTHVYFTSVINREDEIGHLASTLDRPDLVEAMRRNRFQRLASPPSCWRGGGLRRGVYETLVVYRDRLRSNPSLPRETTERARETIATAVGREQLIISEQALAYHRGLVALAEEYGFTLHLVAAPLAPSVRRAWDSNGILDRQRQFLDELASSDAVEMHPPPWQPEEDRLFRDGVHLHIAARSGYGQALSELLLQQSR